MSATSTMPMGSPLGSSTRGVSMDDHNRGRTEFEARVERLVGSNINNFHFYANFENRRGDLEHFPVPGRDHSEAEEAAVSATHGTGLKLIDVDTKWCVAFFDNGQMLDRHSLEKLVAEKGAVS